MTKFDESSVGTTRSSVNRRTVVRAGAHAAWAVPAITLATAAPAHAFSAGSAVSYGPPPLQTVGVSRSTNTVTITNGRVQNVGISATTGLQIIMTVTPGGTPVNLDFRNSTTTTTPSGWTLASSSNDNPSKARVFVFTANAQVNALGGTLAFNPVITLAQAGGGTLTIAPSTTNGSSTPFTRVFA